MAENPTQHSNEAEQDPAAPAPNLTGTEARQGRKEGVVRYVLGFGLPLAVIAMLVIVVVFVLSN
ncbi:MAG TPA: hypothetical protein VIK87_12485 [Sphingomonadales bacterium]|jgi:hypothetical protein